MLFHTIRTTLALLLALTLLGASMHLAAQDRQAFAGEWVVNKDLSDNTDKQVERALRAMGQKIDRCWFGCGEDRYRGGPKEQELYDRLSYDKSLHIELGEPEYVFTYDDGYTRSVYTDGGFANEAYALQQGGSQLRVELFIRPGAFTEPVTIVRVYDRMPSP
jgi:hypothetical protein